MDQEAKSVRDDPRGFYKRFWATPKMIFGKDPDGKILRQMTYIRTYLGILTEYLVKKLGVDRDKAEDLVLAFMARLFASPAIRENAWGYYRHYVATAVCRFARRALLQEARRERRRMTALRWLKMRYDDIGDFVVDRIFRVELRQIRKALEAGLLDDYLNRGVVSGEIAERDVDVWHLSAHRRMTRREIAEFRRDVTADGVKRALNRVDRYFRRHAKELRLALRDL